MCIGLHRHHAFNKWWRKSIYTYTYLAIKLSCMIFNIGSIDHFPLDSVYALAARTVYVRICRAGRAHLASLCDVSMTTFSKQPQQKIKLSTWTLKLYQKRHGRRRRRRQQPDCRVDQFYSLLRQLHHLPFMARGRVPSLATLHFLQPDRSVQ